MTLSPGFLFINTLAIGEIKETFPFQVSVCQPIIDSNFQFLIPDFVFVSPGSWSNLFVLLFF